MTGLMKPLAFVAFALAFVLQAPAAGAEPIKLAQSEQEEGYLPPWQGEEDEATGQDDIGSRDGYEPERLAPPREGRRYDDRYGDEPPRRYDDRPRRYDPPPREAYDEDENYTADEIIAAGHRFFGTVTEGLARVVEYAFSRQGYPNGYILGEEAGGAFVAGLRYGEGMLYTKHLGRHRVFWQGPSIGYDFGAEGSKTMILVYDIQHPGEIYHRFAGVDGSAYFVGGVGITFQRHGEVVLAPIRSGIGLRLGANVGYLKYTREPTWNPF
ncbi:DUF1134 domain-containing protein [Dichotomicrobium thermohalophilum]|uniref:DUF1134 domain-containing protein n=1 Tax=Dichotomicrobium thermohalophilum TaxID=933063 RepID=A0A397QCM7_9HYPH|nr:DUF1134 domain-containing protein [Dichotomicrobium thermohalophilum]RIA55844.1 hypothetical protein BXY53_0929 [Dichotomicrobium thermohalophilum]